MSSKRVNYRFFVIPEIYYVINNLYKTLHAAHYKKKIICYQKSFPKAEVINIQIINSKFESNLLDFE